MNLNERIEQLKERFASFGCEAIFADDIELLTECQAEIARLEAAIRKHRNHRGDDRCWLDDAELYQAIGASEVSVEFCDPDVMLENCKKFIARRHDKNQPYVSPQRRIEALEAEIERLEAELDKLKRSWPGETWIRAT